MAEAADLPQQEAAEGDAEAKPARDRDSIPDDAALVALDGGEEDRARLQGLQEALGRPVWCVDPGQFGLDMLEDLSQAGAVILEWDLGTRLGLEVLGVLARDPRTSPLRVALASAAPTRSMVMAALRAGAWTFLCKPYDAEEIMRRLIPRPAVVAAPPAPDAVEKGAEA
jgi:CheY-like chemotaxis protein